MIILNEKDYVDDILTTGNIKPSKAYIFLNIYARYLYHEKELRKAAIIKELNAFMQDNYPHYNPIDWSACIEKYACNADKYPLCKCNGVWITENELTTIEQLQDKVLERLAFTFLCLAKFRNFKNPDNNNWIACRNGEVYSLACINTTAFEKDVKFNQLKELGLIDYAKRINNLNVQILYTDDSSKKKLFISDFRRLGYEWRLYKGESYIRCARCGILTKKKSNRSKYCKDCAKISTANAKYLWDINSRRKKSCVS